MSKADSPVGGRLERSGTLLQSIFAAVCFLLPIYARIVLPSFALPQPVGLLPGQCPVRARNLPTAGRFAWLGPGEGLRRYACRKHFRPFGGRSGANAWHFWRVFRRRATLRESRGIKSKTRGKRWLFRHTEDDEGVVGAGGGGEERAGGAARQGAAGSVHAPALGVSPFCRL
jgi:hypothetical protein